MRTSGRNLYVVCSFHFSLCYVNYIQTILLYKYAVELTVDQESSHEHDRYNDSHHNFVPIEPVVTACNSISLLSIGLYYLSNSD